jgi:Aspartate/ornithine carbamoyltransferase, carbamoyl-P binding domain
MDLQGRNLLKEIDLTSKEFLYLVDLAGILRTEKRRGQRENRLAGRNIALIFEKASTRTRSAFEVGAHDEGGHVTYLGPDESHLGSGESVKDTRDMAADALVILTDVAAVEDGYGTPQARPIHGPPPKSCAPARSPLGPWARKWKPPAASWRRPTGWPRSAGSTTPEALLDGKAGTIVAPTDTGPP